MSSTVTDSDSSAGSSQSQKLSFKDKMLDVAWRDCLLLGVSCFGSSAMLGTFYLYYLKVFMDGFHLGSSALSIIQFLFLIWNAINDPLLGYMQDLGFCGIEWIKDRRKVIIYAGPFFAASFLLFWFPWSKSSEFIIAVQLLISLFIFDALLTLVFSAFCGLCVEKATKHSERVRVIVVVELFELLAGFLVIPIERLSHNLEYFGVFQSCCIVITIIAGSSYFICGLFISKHDRITEEKPEENQLNELGKTEKAEDLEEEFSGGLKHIMTVSWQIMRQPRFLCLIGGQFFKLIRMMVNEQFLIIFVERLLVYSGYIAKDSVYLPWYYVAVRSMGSILFFVLWAPTAKFGVQLVLVLINLFSVINCLVAFGMGKESYMAVALFLLFENMLSRCGVNGYYTVISGEVIDEDMNKNERKSPYSTIIFTLKALFTKPADQLAPITMFFLFNLGGWNSYKDPCLSIAKNQLTAGNTTINNNDFNSTYATVSTSTCSSLYDIMFDSMVFFPCFCAIFESFFVIFDQFLKRKQIKKQSRISVKL